jgi:penicillin-binding protein 1C
MTLFWRLTRSTTRLIGKLPNWVKLGAMAIIAIGLFAVGSAVLWAALVPIPSINSFENRAVSQSTKIYDRTGKIVLYDVHGNVRRTSVPLDQISDYVQKATIAIEDDEFYTHHGFRPVSFLRAVIADITTGSFGQGGSTITQQVVKNALLTQDKTPIRKAKEIILALRLERIYTKDEILNTYLNENPYGGTIYGIQEAAQYFFGIDAKDVDLAQAAYLAALPQAPTRYSPYGNNRDMLERRKDLVLAKMLEHDFVTQDEYDEAVAEVVQFKDELEAGIKAPHFVFFVREYLEGKYGVDAVYRDGLNVVTTLDYELQQEAEKTVEKFAPGMLANFNASNMGMVAIEPSSGQILAMVGSKGYFDDTIDGKVNVVTASRQPGSSFKPFVYATAFMKGYTPDTVVFDVPTQFSTRCAPSDYTNSEPPCYSPSNYDGTFKGPLTFRNALAISENVPAVKALYLAGIQDSINTAQSLGITSLGDDSQYGLSLVLGGGNVTLLEMTGAYGVFANDGVRNPSTAIVRVADKSGRVLESFESLSERVLEPQIARMINDVLSDNEARTPEFGANSPLYFPGYDVADKTGTTNDFRDVWIIGYTPGISVGAWAGNNNNSPMERRIAAFIIAPMWHEFMEHAIEKYDAGEFLPPAPEPGYESLPPVLRGVWNTNPAEGVHDILHWIQKDNPRSGFGTSRGDGQYPYWEYPVQLWVQGQGFNNGTGSTTPPTTSENFRILSPAAGTVALLGQPIILTSYYAYPQNVQNVTYFINNVAVGTTNQPPYGVTFTPAMAGPAILRGVAQTITGIETSEIQIMIQ